MSDTQRNEAPPNGGKNGNGGALDENAPIGDIKALNGALTRWAPQLTNVAPKGRGFDFERFRAVIMACAARTPSLVLCSYYSIRQAANAAAELGLELGGVSGEAYLIPYKNRKKIKLPNGADQWVEVMEATFMPGYKGYLRLAAESGLFRNVGAAAILPDDVWEPIRMGPEKLTWGHVQNEPKARPKIEIEAERWERGTCIQYKAAIAPIRGAYAFAKMRDVSADDIVKPIWFDRLEEIRKRSKAGMNGPWITDYAEMAQKTAIRNLWKHLPKTAAMKRAEELDQEFDLEEVNRDGRTTQPSGEGKPPPSSDTVVDRAKAKTSSVAAALAQRNAEAKGAQPPPPADSGPELEPDEHERVPGQEG